MSIEILTTSQGIIIKNGEQLVSLSDVHDMFSLLDDDPDLATNIKTVIAEQFLLSAAEIAETFTEMSRFNPEKPLVYVHAMQQWCTLVLQAYPQYREAVESAQNV